MVHWNKGCIQSHKFSTNFVWLGHLRRMSSSPNVIFAAIFSFTPSPYGIVHANALHKRFTTRACQPSDDFDLSLIAHAFTLRAPEPIVMTSTSDEGTVCGTVELKGASVEALARVIKRTYLEGGLKRGLEGAVCVGEEDNAEALVVARGPVSRLASFASWCSNALESPAPLTLDACPAVPLSSRFKLTAVADAASGSLRAVVRLADEEELSYWRRHVRVQCLMLRKLRYSIALDGHVLEVHATGDAAELRSFSRWLRRGGPPMARARVVQADVAEAEQGEPTQWRRRIDALKPAVMHYLRHHRELTHTTLVYDNDARQAELAVELGSGDGEEAHLEEALALARKYLL